MQKLGRRPPLVPSPAQTGLSGCPVQPPPVWFLCAMAVAASEAGAGSRGSEEGGCQWQTEEGRARCWPCTAVWSPCAGEAGAQRSRNVLCNSSCGALPCSSLLLPAPAPRRGALGYMSLREWPSRWGMGQTLAKPVSISPHLKNRQTKPSTL